MTITRADAKQDEFITTSGKLYINIEQEEKKDEDENIFWEMITLQVADKRTAYNEVIAYYETESLRPLRELTINPENEYAKNKIVYINLQIAKYR